jgi:hypothetical protein
MATHASYRAHKPGNPHGVYLAITIAFSTLGGVGALLLRRGRWKTRLV